ncbi:DMT family transporter [Alterisphingorhabdus coralli]|uniref:DMT family transporter n=1 Tax=Alterisphingorhabdus coralli TaxID=3071408 RepID=A0AA97F8B0_9SPHN|nr:DMT family transporter [Parasphingorhabdus sp. SCSIO 66989]WOE76194.1 DMT family transporter [Parasphingorhabdus sp. SCSIO 66989]
MNSLASNRLLPFLACAGGIMTFGAMDAVMKALSLDIGTYNALLWRCMIGALMALLLFLLRPGRMPHGEALRLHIIRASVTAVMAFTFFWGLARTPMAEAIAISFIAPLIALYLAAVLLGEKISRYAIIASLLGLAGVVVIVIGKLGEDFSSEAQLGIAAILVSACLYAWNLILQRQQAQIARPEEIALFQNGIVTFWLALFAPWFAVFPVQSVMPLIGLGALLSIVSVLLLSWAYARAETQALVPIEYSMFLWAALFGWLFFNEPLSETVIIGTVLIVAGCLLATRNQPHEHESPETLDGQVSG